MNKWSKKSDKAAVQASTLAELLVVMVVTSILLLAVTDGLTLFGRYARTVTQRIVRQGETWAGYCRLASSVAAADSLSAVATGRVAAFTGKDTTVLSLRDSVLSFSVGRMADTLLHPVAGLDLAASPDGNDSLIVWLAVDGDKLRIAFPTAAKPSEATPEVRNQEKEYRYE